jgi:excisionase family DNA binding protein
MFNIEVKFTANNREVSLERFSTLFLQEAVRGVLDDVMPKPLLGASRSAPFSPLRHIPEAKSHTKPRVISVGEAARVLGLRPSTIRAWIGLRKIISVHLERRVMIPTEDIDDLLEGGLTPARKDP